MASWLCFVLAGILFLRSDIGPRSGPTNVLPSPAVASQVSFANSTCLGDNEILVSLAVLIALAILLIRAGVELNPGPITVYPDFRVISQNCRGLTDCRKTCRLMKKLSASGTGHSPAIACLQETHCINRFALDNLYKGTYVVDDGERNQKGVSICYLSERLRVSATNQIDCVYLLPIIKTWCVSATN